eukprot:CAMPEP_0197663020 /NCGR_PEP_ID=MMETSP1338-20131121/55813_1 /TAXON_ID=43686 ORGANISM="Pelagodinium beii, Strain RCC1491" /NCGR_SAMPLE_ID=MMETSP1338 /ASSEMBLY_ACC=CAM_ASM_000754 /LENGTH=518 /DNA_ID=CAMNT_0043241191 /DNA_START=41 /DNA_END=1597 /DNA_ORIENTATION=+
MPDANKTPLNEIQLSDIDFEVVAACSDKNYLKKYLKLLADDGNYYVDLIKAAKDKLLQVSPKEYYLLYPRQTTAQEEEDAFQDILEWEANVKETDAALKSSSTKAQKDKIWEDAPGSKVTAPIRGQEPVITSRKNVQREEKPKAMEDKNRKDKDVYARDKTKMKDYYRAWDQVDVDAIEDELDEEERQEEAARKAHFDDLREDQDRAQAIGEIGAAPIDVPEAHKKHMSDSEKEKGNEAFYSKDWAEAEAYYTRSLQYKADDPSTWSNRALVRLKLEKPDKALQDCEHALALNPNYMKALHRKGKALYELKRYEEAVKSFQLALAESPGNTQINGDLMVARRRLRSDGPSSEPKVMPGRRVDAEPSCRIEELDDDEPVAAPSAPAAGYTRVAIEEDSDSEEEPAPAPTASSSSKGKGFLKVAIEEVSGSEDEEESATASAKTGQAGAASSSAGKSPVGPSSTGFRKVAIVEESESEGSTPTPPATSAGKFSPPPRTSPAAPASTAPALTTEVSFNDMD